jgi:curli biogenesis system outer membrane secretion channel CsgG
LILSLNIIIFPAIKEVKADDREESVKTQEYTPYFGPKKRVAVLDFKVKAAGAEDKIGSSMAEMLITALHNTGRYIVLERESQAFKDMLREQDLGKEGRIMPETAAKFGELLGAQVLIKGVVTEFCQYETIKGVGLFVKGLTLGGGGIITAHVAVDIRMFDTSTGEIIESHRTEQKARTVVVAGGVKIGDVVIGGVDFHKTPLGKATRKAIEDMVDFIVSQLKAKPWEGRIVIVKNDKVIINAGLDVGIRVGDIMDVWTTGEELIDPVTGLSLGVEEGEKIGTIEVTDVKEKYSVAKILTGTGFKRNDIIRMLSE